jgi:hypothetical protein
MNNLIHQDDLDHLIQNGGTVHDRAGEQIGTLGRFYVPDGTREAACSVKTKPGNWWPTTEPGNLGGFRCWHLST